MADNENAPRLTNRDALRKDKKLQTASKTSLQPLDFSRCDRSCGSCFITYVGDLRYCEAEFLAQCRRELAELLAGGGDHG